MTFTKFFHEGDRFLDEMYSKISAQAGTLIHVDPYYLVHRAEELCYHPQVILAGRAINDSMPAHVAGMMIRGLNEAGNAIKAIFSQKIE